MLAISDLCFAYSGTVPLLQHCSLQLAAGERVLLRGPNGCGKSTLLRLIAGRLTPQCGSIARHGRMALLVQESGIDWQLPFRVRDVVASGLAAGRPWWHPLPPRRGRRLEEALAAMDCSAIADRPVSQLSGGQRQRMLIARTLLQSADCLLLDEPLSGLDRDARGKLATALARITGPDSGRSLIVVSHEIADFPLSFDQDLHFADGALRPTAEHHCEVLGD